MLEMEMSSSQQNLDCVVELATEQNISAREKFGEVISLCCKLLNLKGIYHLPTFNLHLHIYIRFTHVVDRMTHCVSDLSKGQISEVS